MDDQNAGMNERGVVRERAARGGAADPGFASDEYTVDTQHASAQAAEDGPEVRTREIRAEIDRTREEMTETIDAIQDRLSPRRMVSRAADNVREATIEKVRSMANSVQDRWSGDSGTNVPRGFMDRIRENPVAAALAVGSLTWLAFAGGRRGSGDFRPAMYRSTRDDETFMGQTRTHHAEDDHAYGEASYRHHDSGRQSQGGTLLDRAQTAARSAGAQVGQSVHETTDRVRTVGRQGRQRAARLQNENPLAAGAVAAGIGLAIGLAIPETERENELMGEARDLLLDKGRETVREAAVRVQDAAEGVQRAATAALDAATPGSEQHAEDPSPTSAEAWQSPAGTAATPPMGTPEGGSATGDSGTRRAGRTRRSGSSDVTGADNP